MTQILSIVKDWSQCYTIESTVLESLKLLKGLNFERNINKNCLTKPLNYIHSLYSLLKLWILVWNSGKHEKGYGSGQGNTSFLIFNSQLI